MKSAGRGSTAELSHAIRVDLLGGFSVRVGDREVPAAAFERRKARSLVKLLALQPDRRLPRDRALELLWPGLDAQSAAGQLYKAMSQARQALLGAGARHLAALVDLRDQVVSLDAPGGVVTDVARFEEGAREALRERRLEPLREAAASYRGELLPEDLYEEWTQEPRERLLGLFLDVQVALGEALLRPGRAEEAADAFRRVLAREATREAAHRGLMQAYARLGDAARAARQYQICERALEEELDAEPSAETSALRDAIARGEIVAGRGAPGARPERPPMPPLVGRELELSVFAARLDDLAGGRGSSLALEGPGGIGKTRLGLEIAALARARGFAVMSGSAHEQEGPLPFGPFAEALDGALRADRSHQELLPAPLASFLPSLPAGAAPFPAGDPVASQGLLFAGVRRFLAAKASASPLLLLLEDLHAADEASLALFHALSRHAASMPLLLVGTWRWEEPGAPRLHEMVLGLQRAELLVRLRLPPLSQVEQAALLARDLGGELEVDLAAWLYRYSEGNPLFARELARQLVQDRDLVRERGRWRARSRERPPVPPSLGLLTGPRWTSLSGGAQRLVQLAALAGDEAPLRLIERADRGEGPLLDRLEEALAAGLLEETGAAVRFPHALHREAVAQDLSRARSRELHAALAEALEELHRDDPSLAVEAIAHHHARAGHPVEAVRFLLAAGDRAEAVFAHDDAAARFQEALALASEPGVPAELRARAHERVGDVHRAVGDVARALPAYRAALTASAGGANAVLHRKAALAAILATDMASAAADLQTAEERAAGDGLETARVAIARALFDWHCNELERAIGHASRALDLAEAAGARQEASQACEMLALSLLPLGRWEEGLRYELRRTAAGWSPEVVVATDGHLCLWEYHVQGEEPFQRAKAFIDEVARVAAAKGDLRCVAVCHYALGSMAALRGLVPEPAASHLEQALQMHRSIGSNAGAAYTLARHAAMLTALGELARGWERIQAGLEHARGAAVRDHCLQRLYSAGLWNRVEARDLAAAAELARVASEVARAGLCNACGVQLHPALAAYHLAAGDLTAAAREVESGLLLAEKGHNAGAEALARRLQGELLLARGENEGATALLSQAADAFGALGMRPDQTRALQLLSRAGA